MTHYRVLLIDDNDDFRHNMSELLYDDGLTVIHAQDAYTGLRSANMYRPHVIVCDSKIGNSTAIDMMKMLKETGNSSLGAIPFIFLCSDLDKKTVLEAQIQGVEHFINKLHPWPAMQKAIWSVLTPSIH